jgi:AcrR family transcriptional regulator
MSRNVLASTHKSDRRVLRTRDRLGDALVALILEKPFETITVQDVLDRAGVARSTFYTHFRDKDDLFLSDVEDFFESMATLLLRSAEASDRIAPVRELFAHVAEQRQFLAALTSSGKLHDVLQLAQAHFARAIEQRLAGLARASAISPGQRAAYGQAFAGAMLSLLTWWIDRDTPASAEQMDDLYHRMVWNGLQP